MKNENKRGETARNEQDQTRNQQQTGRTPVKQDLPGRNEKESYDREAPEEREGAARKTGKPSESETRQPVKQDKRATGEQREDEDQDQRPNETDPATAPTKTRETPKGNSPKM